jgi:transcriptional regulator of acetoin/glycerol metabolism
MARSGQTVTDETGVASVAAGAPVPGLLLVFSKTPLLRAEPLREAGLQLGRSSFDGKPLDDDRISGTHARVAFDGEAWTVEDLGSRNGTHVNGEPITSKASLGSPGVVRLGRSLFLMARDVRPFVSAPSPSGSRVQRRGAALLGPATLASWGEIERAARHGDVLLVSGESGVGKELAARAFHEAGPRATGPFIAVNCAAIPEGLAERLLFGAKRGAYSGATDAEGYMQAAHGGTLFLDEVADLDAPVQAKLLRAIEAKEVTPLGASRARSVDVRICSAAHDLRAEVNRGHFRPDLYFRIGRPEVKLLPLRERREEIPWLIAAELARVSAELSASASFVEACLLRPWPGNVRELLSEMRRIASAALAAGRTSIGASDLGADVGLAFAPPEPESDSEPETEKAIPDRATIELTLQKEGGNVSRAARALGLHRNQLRRWLAKNGSALRVASGSKEPDED